MKKMPVVSRKLSTVFVIAEPAPVAMKGAIKCFEKDLKMNEMLGLESHRSCKIVVITVPKRCLNV